MGDNERNSGVSLRKQKGWIGFVRSYKEVTENGNWEKVDWGKGTKKPKKVEKDGNRTVYTF